MKSGKKHLEQFTFESLRAKYRNVPAYALPRPKYKTSTANGLTQAIVKYLNLKGHFASRTSSAGRYIESQKKWIPGTTRKGYPDITSTINGRAVFIEVKVGRDKMSDVQHRVRKEIEASGGLYHIARDFDEFVNWYETIK